MLVSRRETTHPARSPLKDIEDDTGNAKTAFNYDGPSHTYSQLEKLVEQGSISLILLGVFTSVNKTTVISAFMGFIRCVTILRPPAMVVTTCEARRKKE
ncbi:hypothetical protein PAMP_011691 [Pampus punctatissimus]